MRHNQFLLDLIKDVISKPASSTRPRFISSPNCIICGVLSSSRFCSKECRTAYKNNPEFFDKRGYKFSHSYKLDPETFLQVSELLHDEMPEKVKNKLQEMVRNRER